MPNRAQPANESRAFRVDDVDLEDVELLVDLPEVHVTVDLEDRARALDADAPESPQDPAGLLSETTAGLRSR